MTTKAKITNVKIGNITIEGSMLPNGTFAVAVPQIVKLFGIINTNASRDFKLLLGGDSGIIKIATELRVAFVRTIGLN